ncbi:hypothetical protein ACS0TY_009101 [Phlomoides rotata]
MGETAIKEKVKKFMKDDVLKLQSRPYPPSIYKVPKELRNGHHKIFDPVSVPIGPLHYDDKCPAQQLKKWCLKNFIDRYEDKEESLDMLAECMSDLESEVRQCYKDIDEEKVGGEELVKIMLLDGCFIMELLWNMDESSVKDQPKPFETVLDSVPFLTLQQDLLKIENQLPFIVLKSLASLAPEDVKKKINKPASNKQRDNEDNNVDRYMIRLVLNFFNISTPTKTYATKTPRHLLELVMNALFLNTQNTSVSIKVQKDDDDNSLDDARSASEMEFYGISFKAVDSRNMAKIDFTTSGELRMPKLNIEESTLWNFLIFEMLSCMTRIVSSYVVLMGTLINSEKDVEVLLGSKILASRGRDAKSMVSMFTELSATVNKKNFCFGQLMKNINTYCTSHYRKMRANFVRKYYDSRWELLNNILLFILTSTQTLFSVLGYNPMSRGSN